jgi:hypothetical protein
MALLYQVSTNGFARATSHVEDGGPSRQEGKETIKPRALDQQVSAICRPRASMPAIQSDNVVGCGQGSSPPIQPRLVEVLSTNRRCLDWFRLGHQASDFGFSGGLRRGTRLIAVDSLARRSKPCRARVSSPFDVALPDTRASFSSLVSSAMLNLRDLAPTKAPARTLCPHVVAADEAQSPGDRVPDMLGHWSRCACLFPLRCVDHPRRRQMV